MTRRSNFPDVRSVSLRLHIGGRGITWGVVYRTARGADIFDRRVSSGMLATTRPVTGPAAVVEALEAACDDIRRRHGLPPREAGSGAPGGGGGRLSLVTHEEPSTLPGID